VSANSLLRTELSRVGQERGLEVRLPPMALCLDNAAMIGGLGLHVLEGVGAGEERTGENGWRGDALSLSASPSSR
jgi:tRNA A37 threonylcarbamoyltransferase TsaD